MTGDPERDKLNDLAARIREAGAKPEPVVPDSAKDSAGMMAAGRFGFDFVATVLGCGAVGFLVDRQLGSQPWVMLGMLLVGFVVGFANLWRSLAGYDEGIGWRKKDEKR